MVRVPRFPQTQAMAAGSAFDSYCKAHLLGDVGKYDSLFEQTVEEQNREWAYPVGRKIFEQYVESGALRNLESDMVPGSCEPLESVEKVIKGVTLMGKPDLLYESKRWGEKVVVDWKCNGYCSKNSVSPTPGFVDIFPSREIHKNCMLVNGINVEDIHPKYQLQLVIYKLICDAEIVGIDQLVFDKNTKLRMAKHRHKVSSVLIEQIISDAMTIWEMVQTYEDGKSFGSLSATRCTQLREQASVLKDPVFSSMVGR